DGREQRTPASRRGRLGRVVRYERPDPERDEPDGERPGERGRRAPARDPHPGGGGQRVIEGRRDQDTEHDGPRAAESRGEGERDQLGLVAHLGEGDDEKRRPERGHVNETLGGSGTEAVTSPPYYRAPVLQISRPRC